MKKQPLPVAAIRGKPQQQEDRSTRQFYMTSSTQDLTGQLTRFTSETHLGKEARLIDGKLIRKALGELYAGTYQVTTYNDAQGLIQLLEGVSTHQAISNSLPTNGSLSGVIRTAETTRGDELARTKENFNLMPGPGLMTFDYDPPDHAPALTQAQLWGALQKVCPKAADATVIGWCSGSSHIHGPEGELTGLRGQRLYLPIRDVSDITRAKRVLEARCWFEGFGYIKISKAGTMLSRYLFDDAMFSADRLDFAGGTVCIPPLTQQRPAPNILSDGPMLDTREAFSKLTDQEEARFKRLVEAAKKEAAPRAAAQREKWLESRVNAQAPALSEQKQIPLDEARKQVRERHESALQGNLPGDFEIPLPGGTFVTVDEALSNPDKWHMVKTLDPIEPGHRGFEACGILYLKQDRPKLYTLAHGEISFNLVPSRKVTKFDLMTGLELLAQKPTKWMIQGILPEQGLGAVYGAPGSGKTFLVLDLALAVARGMDWFGKRTRPTPVVYFPLEGTVNNRLKAWMFGADQEAPPDNFRVVRKQGFDFNNPDDVDGLTESVKAFSQVGALTIIDTLARATPGTDENSSRDMGLVIKAADRLATETKGFVLLVHHSGKDESRGMRGSSSVLGAIESLYKVTGSSETPRCFTVEKNKEGKDGERFHFRLDTQTVGFDPEYSEDITSCSISQCSEEAATARGLGNNQAKLLEALTEALKSAHTDLGYAPPGTPALTAADARKVGIAAGLDRKRLPEAIEALLKRGTLKTGGPLGSFPGKPIKMEKVVWLA